MLEKYEQKVLLEYLIVAVNEIKKRPLTRDTEHKLFDFIDIIEDIFENGAISFSLGDIYFERKTQRLTKEEIKTGCINIIKKLKNEYKKFNKAELSKLEKYFKIIQKIFNLTDEERIVFSLIARNEWDETFCECLCLASDRYRNADTQRMCNTYLKHSSTFMVSINHLLDLGLFINESCRGLNIGIPESLKKTITNTSKISYQKIIEALMGTKIKTDLTKKDFAHLKNEMNILETILDNAIEKKQKGINILLYGEAGTGKTEFAKLIAKLLKIPMYEVDCEDEKKEEANKFERLTDFRLKNRVCANVDTKQILLFDEAEDIFTDTIFFRKTSSKAYVNRLLENNPVPVIWTTNDIENMDKAYLRRFTYSVKFEKLSDEVQLKFLKKEFKKNDFKISDKKLEELSKKYDLSSAVITNSIMLTKLTNSPDDKLEDFIKQQILLLNRGKIKGENFNVNKKSENYNFNLVNTDMKIENLTDKISSTGKLNFSLCLYGEAGTGKSEYAKQLADKLGLEVIFRRASDLMSKWVGETEQNIAKAFKEARDKKAVLIFDEADSLLQSRGNAQRSWEISQVNEMLTWMESHPYPFICTTNFMDSLDEASLRRFTFKIKFNYMTTEQVQQGFKHFFDKEVSSEIANIKGLTAGDFATVKKKIEFLGIDDIFELKQMLEAEVKVKKSKELSSTVGF